MARTLPAKVTATDVEVACPRCGEVVPDPKHGSTFWTTDQLRKEAGQVHKCRCGVNIKLHAPSRVALA